MSSRKVCLFLAGLFIGLVAISCQGGPDSDLPGTTGIFAGTNPPGGGPTADNTGSGTPGGMVPDGTMGSGGASGGTGQLAAGMDPFGVKEIYPTVAGGREWFVNMADPRSDPLFNPENATKQGDGSWQVSGQIRMDVGKKGMTNWKNVEMTGYVRMVSTSGSGNGGPHIAWYARGGTHSTSAPCEGTSYKGHLYPTGRVGFKKELWHTGGYSKDLGSPSIPNFNAIGKWVGFKTILWNIDGDQQVHLQNWLDRDNNDNWVMVSDLLDTGVGSGKLCADSSQSAFDAPGCTNPLTQQKMAICDIISWGGWAAVFRSDNLTWDFKNLSVREIAGPQ